MAGLGEACTHIAAVLFHTEAVSRMRGSTTCTQLECQWVIPSYQKDIPYVPLHKLDFSSAKSKKIKVDSAIATSSKSTTTASAVKKTTASHPPGQDELQSFYHRISQCSSPTHENTLENLSCLLQNEDGLELDRTHAYYYQVQTQIFIAKVDYCDFCVCTIRFLLIMNLVCTLSEFYLILSFGLVAWMLHRISLSNVYFLKF